MEKLKFIEGNFSGDEAKEILLKIFNSKINFHKIKNFSSQEREGTDDYMEKKSITELQISLEKIKSIVNDAKIKNKSIIIKSEIEIIVE